MLNKLEGKETKKEKDTIIMFKEISFQDLSHTSTKKSSRMIIWDSAWPNAETILETLSKPQWQWQ